MKYFAQSSPEAAMLRKVLFATAFVLAAFVPSIAQGSPSGTLVVALPNDPTSLFPPRGADITAGNAARPLYNSLVRLNDANELEPELATSWEIDADGVTYTFKLREGVTFHNGEPFNAESVIASWQASADPSNDYAQVYTKVVSVEALDDAAQEQLRELIRRSPRDVGYETSLWTLDLLAQACFEQGITVKQVNGETIRATLAAMGISWRRVKQFINSPDPHYGVKKSGETG
jgi:hypothetical protein